MEKIFMKLIISIAIGAIVGLIAEQQNKVIKYYVIAGEPALIPISKAIYDEGVLKDSSKYLKEEIFNTQLFFYYGGLSGAGLIIILLLPNLINRSSNVKRSFKIGDSIEYDL